MLFFYANQIKELLINKKYIPCKSHEFKIKDGVSKKERIINKPKFYPDQIIHHSIILQIEKCFMRGMYHYSCASIKNRGIYYASKYLKKY